MRPRPAQRGGGRRRPAIERRAARLEADLARERRRAEAGARRAVLAAMVADLASGFVNAPVDTVDAARRQALQELCHAVGGDRCTLAAWDSAAARLRWEMSWSPARFTPRGTGSVDLSAVPAWLEAAREGRPLEVADAARLPDGDPLRGLLAGWGCLALLALPLMEEERCTGFLVVELLGAARRIGADEFAALVVACELFANSGMRRQRELALEQALLDARASIRAKDAFLATMSHELRTPLNGIIGLAELLADARPGEDQRGRAATIACSARELLEVIQGVIELARLQGGGKGGDPEPCDPGAVVAGALTRLAPAAGAGALVVHRGDGLPARVITDAAALATVARHLAGNARKFAPGGPYEIELGWSDGLLRLRVADRGPGVPPGLIAALGRPFEMADASDTRRQGGAGLGLALSRGLLTAAGGGLVLANRAGGGFEAIAELPAEALAQPQRVAGLRDRRVLLAGTPGPASDAAASVLASAGAQPESVTSLAAAIARLADGGWSALVLDGPLDGVAADELAAMLAADPQLGRTPILDLRGAAVAGRPIEDLPSIILHALASGT